MPSNRNNNDELYEGDEGREAEHFQDNENNSPSNNSNNRMKSKVQEYNVKSGIKETDYKNIILHKDRAINELKSTIEVGFFYNFVAL